MRRQTISYLIISSILLILTILFKLINIANFSKGLANTLIFFSLAITIILTIAAIFLKERLTDKNLQSLDLLWFTLTIISIISFINIFFFSTAKVSQNSMLPTYKEGDLLLVSHFKYNPKNNDIVILKTKDDELYIKRIMAMEGDLITFNEDELGTYILINNEVIYSLEDEQYKYYINSSDQAALKLNLRSGKIPKDKFFVLGDNARNSNDSRNETVGLIDLKDILGKVSKTIRGGK